MLGIPALGEERQVCQFKTSLGYLVHLCPCLFFFLCLCLCLCLCISLSLLHTNTHPHPHPHTPHQPYTFYKRQHRREEDRREEGTVFIIYPLDTNFSLPCGVFVSFYEA